MIEVVEISKRVLSRLSKLDNETLGGNSTEQLLFPQKLQADGEKVRVSEQELRLLFIEEFRKTNPNLFYSIETPTKKKCKFGKTHEEIVKNANTEIRSASIDLCIFNKVQNTYNRILNIEFKHGNKDLHNTSKDILKLAKEENDGAFIQLLESKNITFRNQGNTGVLDKLFQSFDAFKSMWQGEYKIQVIILSLHNFIASCVLSNKDIQNLRELFFQDAPSVDRKNLDDSKRWHVSSIE